MRWIDYMVLILDPAVHAAVEVDGLPREAGYDDGLVRMLYRDGAVARSCLLADWPAEQAALAARDAERQQRTAARAALRAALTPIRGKQPAQWSLPELRDLVAVLLDQAGLLDSDGAVAGADARPDGIR